MVVADYDLIQHDFPALATDRLVEQNPGMRTLDRAGRTRRAHKVIDDWLVGNAAVISSAQCVQAEVNTPIDHESAQRIAFRPPSYGRSLIVPVAYTAGLKAEPDPQTARLLDVKGAGVAPGVRPVSADYGNGLEYLGCALADLVLKALVDAVFEHTRSAFTSVPVYAVLDLGFDVLSDRFGRGPAGMHVRRAHRRPTDGMSVPFSGSKEERAKAEVEFLLRSYGITTTNGMNALEIDRSESDMAVINNKKLVVSLPPADREFLEELLGGRTTARLERINVQFADDVHSDPPSGSVVDFGHVNVKERFVHAVCSPVRDRPLCLGGVLWPESDDYIQPDPALAVPFAQWNRQTLNDACTGLAHRFRDRELTAREVDAELRRRVAGALDRWSTY
ncbi:hypothetical protein Acsp06_62630 [Actinomycetospora sp. NBRC 106375]|uniref:hypothetical protein n=1 Tax=Actinomycetospora sp. NBRC 106375 TaxID=3032207 RepID=UPI0024A0D9FE|nr:hypothetical protein [Actinomycetospora sp. NBRC 106375]GLZ50078.1 hypothetical protein Acsp06_62630 [Actinomycetospora sp. NBRC 106375]